jgi:hypothetical protein
MRQRILLFTACMGLATLGGASPLRAQARPAAPAAQPDSASLPAHDTHQGVTVAVRPLTAEAAYKTQFPGKQTPYDSGILALEVFFRNDNDKPIRLKLATIRLLVNRAGQSPQRIEPLSAEEVADRVLLKTPSDPRVSRLPLPGSRGPKPNRDKNWQEYAGRMGAAGIPSDIVGPKATVRGFLFFDVAHHYDWLTDARLDVPDIAFMLNNEALFFFQVDLVPALR